MFKHKFYYIFVLFIPLEQLLNVVFGFYTEFKIYRVLLFVLVLYLSLSNLSLKKIVKPPLGFMTFICILIYGVIVGLIRISHGAGSMDYFVNSLQHYVIGLSIFYVMANIKNAQHLERVAKYFVIGTIISAAYGLYQFGIESNYRLNGLFTNPNHLAFAINILSPYLVFNYVNKRTKYHLFLFVLFSSIVFFTGSRTGLIVQLVNIILLLLMLGRSKGVALRMVLVLSTTAVLYVSYIAPMISQNQRLTGRYEVENVQNASGRFDIAEAVIKLANDTYYTGVGMGQYRYYHKNYISSTAYATVTKHDLGTHNHFLDLLVNFGGVSLIIYTILLVGILKKILNVHHTIRPYLLCSIIGISIISLSQEVFTLPLFWLFFGGLVSLLEIIKQRYFARA